MTIEHENTIISGKKKERPITAFVALFVAIFIVMASFGVMAVGSMNDTVAITDPVLTAESPAMVELGNASGFAILSQTGITSVSTASVINGDVGVNATGTSIDITCEEVNGTIYAIDDTGPACSVVNTTFLDASVRDMEAAYTDASERTPDATFTPVSMDGMTFTPGVYRWSAAATLTAGADITISGNATDVWIFQITDYLSIGAGANVILTGGANASNIFWQVGNYVSFGADVVFNGNILSDNYILFGKDTVLNGRALTNADVNLDTNIITAPSPMPPSEPQNLQAIPGVGQVSLSWEAPSDDGGSEITYYNIYRGTSPGNQSYLDSVDGSTTTYNDTSVISGQIYYYYITAENTGGVSAESNEVNATPLDSLTIPLEAGGDAHGWNFVSFNVIPENTSIQSILTDPSYGISGNYDKVFSAKPKFVEEHDTLFSDDVESGAGEWTVDGNNPLWHISNNRYNSYNHSWAYNDGVDYDTGSRNNGTLICPWMDITDFDSVLLSYYDWVETEDTDGYDPYSLYVQTDKEGWTQVFEEYQSNKIWEKQEFYLEDHVDIPNARGLRIRFSFDTVDHYRNNFEGWYIDDIEIAGVRTVVSKHSNDWSSYVPGRPPHFNNLERLNESMGFWIRMTSNDNLTIVGKTPTVTNITLQPGWNMVGYPCSTSNIASDILPPEVSKIGVFSASAEYNVAYIYEDMFEFISIQTGRGYWMYNDADEAVIWIVDY